MIGAAIKVKRIAVAQAAEGLTPWKVTLETRVARGGNAGNAVALPADATAILDRPSSTHIERAHDIPRALRMGR